MARKSSHSLDPILREIVHESVAILGEVIRKELGDKKFVLIERLREKMRNLKSEEETFSVLNQELASLRKLSPADRMHIVRAFTLMLELMNACENAFRSRQIQKRVFEKSNGTPPHAIIYVLTAHPTEARSPENIWIFHKILTQLTRVLKEPQPKLSQSDRVELTHSIELAWLLSIVRSRKPKVSDEAEHIYSTLLRDETLCTLLELSDELAPIYIRSWVGGDKDGHPGVDEKTFIESLQLSRTGLLSFCEARLKELKETLAFLPESPLVHLVKEFERDLGQVKKVTVHDAKRVKKVKAELLKIAQRYTETIGVTHPSLRALRRLFYIFPGLVVPLEFREASDVMMSEPTGRGLAIFRMLQTLAKVSLGGDPRWYVRGLIISMASKLIHLQTAGKLVQSALGDLRLPVIPLFEQEGALRSASKIAEEVLSDKVLSRALHEHWNSQFEVMLGYSDSSKESGVLNSRLQVAESMYSLEKVCRKQKRKVEPLFFQGSGGSTDRGGGSVEEQTAWWSSSALKNYKVTLQGEIVERSLATNEIIRGQLERIVQSASQWEAAEGRTLPRAPELESFASLVASHYKTTLKTPAFLQVIEKATPYPYLNLLKFGSRPTKRTKGVSIEGLRAIPWILCWTQTRMLFPTWWGVGSAWRETSRADQVKLKKLVRKHPVFSTFVRALEYTLAKVEPSVWRLYLEQSGLPEKVMKEEWNFFQQEHRLCLQFLRDITGSKGLVSWRPWLRESISLRSPMIHPLNLLQIIAIETKDADLLRLSVAGISSGMMTTG